MKLELVPNHATPVGHGIAVDWAGGDNPLRGTIGPWFQEWGTPSPVAVSLARIGVGIFLADRMARRPKRLLRRALAIAVHVPAIAEVEPLVPTIESLLHWVSGDDWTIRLVHDDHDRPDEAAIAPWTQRVGLLSGGLDSFCGAVISSSGSIVYLGHGDASNVRATQDDVVDWFAQSYRGIDMRTAWLLPPTRAGKEPSRRSRAAFFVLLAVALTDASGATEIEIPENGFTSLNPPLGPNRGGVWTTRSTHPRTMELFDEVLAASRLGIRLVNPYVNRTKGELVRAASDAAAGVPNFTGALAGTQSCAKADGRFYGGKPKENCGLCFACVVRRGGILAALGTDPTPYLVDVLPANNRAELIARRRSDINAIRSIVRRGISEARLLATGPFGQMPFDEAYDLVGRSLRELALVPLP